MNGYIRYLFVTVALLSLVFGVAIWLEPEAISTAVEKFSSISFPVERIAAYLGPVVAIATIASAIVAILTYRKMRSRDIVPNEATTGVLEGGSTEEDGRGAWAPAWENLLPAEESLISYLDSLAARLKELGLQEKRFVHLKGEEGEDPDDIPLELEQAFEKRDKADPKPIDILSAHRKFKQYVLLGAPGSGKSTCLRYLALNLIEACRADPENAYIPIFCSLAEWSDRRQGALAFIQQAVVRLTSRRNRLAADLETYLTKGRLVVILDGLNEMPSRSSFRRADENMPARSDREQLADDFSSGQLFRQPVDPREEKIRELARNKGVRSRFILSCRTHEFSRSPQWKQIHVRPMDPAQIDSFIRKYLPANHKALSAILAENEALKSLARNPFYLQLMTYVFDRDLRKIENRGEFLEFLLRALIKRERDKGNDIDIKHFSKVLGTIAFRMIDVDMIGSQVDLATFARIDDEVRSAGIGTGILVESADGRLTFYHQLLQEFLAAFALREGFVRSSLRRLSREEKWVEMIVLYQNLGQRRDRDKALRQICGLLKQRNGLTLRPARPPEFLFYYMFIIIAYGFVTANLVIDVIVGEGLWLGLARAHPATLVGAYFGVPITIHYLLPALYFHRKGIANTAYVLGQIRDLNAIWDLIHAYGRMGISRPKISEVLLEFGELAVPMLLQGLDSKKSNIRKGCINALGLMKCSDAVERLVAILETGEVKYYSETVQALSRIGDRRCEVAIAELVAKIDFGSQFLAFLLTGPRILESLKKIQRFDREIIMRIVDNADKKYSHFRRQLAIQALGAYGHEAGLDALVAIAHDPEDKFCGVAIQSLGLIRSRAGIPHLVSLIESTNDEKVFNAAVKALSGITHPAAVAPLTDLLQHDHVLVRDAALKSLGLISDPLAVPALLQYLPEVCQSSGEELAEALGRIASVEAFDGLKTLAEDPRTSVSEKAITYMDLRYPDRAWPQFLEWLRTPDFPNRPLILKLLADAPPPGEGFEKLLLHLQQDTDPAVARLATEGYSRMNRGLEHRLKQIGVTVGGSWLSRLGVYFAERSGWREFQRRLTEAQLTDEISGFQGGARYGPKLVELAKNDPELGKKLRPLLIICVILCVFIILMLGALPVIVVRVFHGIGALAVDHFWLAGLIVAVAIVSYLPGLRNGLFIPVVGFIYNLARFISVVILIGIVFRYGPGLVADGVEAVIVGIAWAGNFAWEYRWISGVIVVVSGMLYGLRSTGPFRNKYFSLLRRISTVCALVIVIVAVLYVIIFYSVYSVPALGVVLMLIVGARWRRRKLRLDNSYSVDTD